MSNASNAELILVGYLGRDPELKYLDNGDTQPFTFSNAVYAGEKLRRALRDLRYALREIVIGYRLDTPLPAIFTEADTMLCNMREDI